jgi:magnesium-transporting ATPase (P-type)
VVFFSDKKNHIKTWKPGRNTFHLPSSIHKLKAERSTGTNQHKNTHTHTFVHMCVCQCIVSIHVPRQVRPIMARKNRKCCTNKTLFWKQLYTGYMYVQTKQIYFYKKQQTKLKPRQMYTPPPSDLVDAATIISSRAVECISQPLHEMQSNWRPIE